MRLAMIKMEGGKKGLFGYLERNAISFAHARVQSKLQICASYLGPGKTWNEKERRLCWDSPHSFSDTAKSRNICLWVTMGFLGSSFWKELSVKVGLVESKKGVGIKRMTGRKRNWVSTPTVVWVVEDREWQVPELLELSKRGFENERSKENS